jgi:hypothetical protein
MITLFTSDQFILIPTIGFVREGGRISITFAWLMFGLSMTIIETKEK